MDERYFDEDMSFSHKLLVFRRTKILATLGPSSTDPSIMKKLFLSGADIVRINFSHGNPEDHVNTIKTVRTVAKECGRPVTVIGDLCGPKIRVGKFKNGEIRLKEGTTVKITSEQILGEDSLISSQYKGIENEVQPGHRILLNDGALELKSAGIKSGMLEAEVIRGGVLKDNKGMNLPDTKLSISALTAKDRNDVPYCIRADVDYLALSFVRRPSDVLELKEYLKELNADIPIIAKIEKPEALSNISEILNVSDGIMVARGDLGVEMPARKVPLIQNELIKRASQFNKPVIVATQMLESMIENAKPTRAEVTDVAFACMNGADAVMLSAETAAGKYPVEAVEMMDAILREVEAYQWAHGRFSLKSVNIKREELQNAIGIATSQLSRDLKTRCIAVLTRSGKTARIVSSDKPASPVFALSGSEKVVRQLNLMWGVVPFHIRKELKFSEYVKEAEKLTKQKKIAKKGDYILILSGMSDKSGETNSIVVHRIS